MCTLPADHRLNTLPDLGNIRQSRTRARKIEAAGIHSDDFAALDQSDAFHPRGSLIQHHHSLYLQGFWDSPSLFSFSLTKMVSFLCPLPPFNAVLFCGRQPPQTCYQTTNAIFPQAHKFVITAFLTGSRILGRSFVAAYKQAQASTAYQRAQTKNGGSSGGASLSSGMNLDEACKILNVKPPAGGQANVEEVLERYKRLFDANDPQKGGSFYLQSKIVRAKERFERELGPIREKVEAEAEIKEGFKPKVYKDR